MRDREIHACAVRKIIFHTLLFYSIVFKYRYVDFFLNFYNEES